MTKNGTQITCKIDHFVLLVVQGLSSASASSSSSTSRKQETTSQEPSEMRIDPTVSENQNRANPNMHSDSAVSGNRSEAHPDKTRSDVTGLGNRSGTESDKMERDDESQDVPEWLQNFTENLEEPEIPAPAHISREDSDSERPTKVVEKSKLRKRSFYIHFPEDRNCDVCLRTEITSSPCRRRTGEASLPRAEKFGDLITADHNVLHEESESRNNHRYAVSRNKILLLSGFNFIREKNLSGDAKEFTEVFRTVTKAKSHLH